MKFIYVIILQVLALSTTAHSTQRHLRAKANRRTNRPSPPPTSTPTVSQSTRRRPKTSKRTRRPISSPVEYDWNQVAKLTASDGAEGDKFGESVSLDGDVAFVAAPRDNDRGFSSGSVYVLEKDDSTGVWNETVKLTASDGAMHEEFGHSVSVSGNAAIISAFQDDDKGPASGSAYVFEKNDIADVWSETAKLTASDGVAGATFGWSVSISEQIALVSARSALSGLSSAYVFEKNESTGNWDETAILTGSDRLSGDLFGFSVSVSGNIAIVGAYRSRPGGAAYVFEKDESTGSWNETARLTASNAAAGDSFGYSVSISDGTAIVGAYRHDGNNGDDSGSAYIFEKNDLSGIWSETAILEASDGAANDIFGFSVSVSENMAIVGAKFDDDNGENSGSAYVFMKDESTGDWSETAKLSASDGESSDEFGYSVSVSGDAAIVSAFQDDDNGFHSGSVYAFERVQK